MFPRWEAGGAAEAVFFFGEGGCAVCWFGREVGGLLFDGLGVVFWDRDRVVGCYGGGVVVGLGVGVGSGGGGGGGVGHVETGSVGGFAFVGGAG